ncbi:KH domain-containing protein [archaeon]|jgi:transcription termination/antitermination protein NusA|nr:KH domain-containing protein [archaeon]MBT6697468.1 KH domain-containing protein [archaeon]
MSKRVKLNLDSFAYANIATKVMKLPPKAVFEAEDQFHIVVPMGTVGKAIGKGAQNVKRLEQLLKKKIKIIEFHPHIKTFVAKLIAPLDLESIEEKQAQIILKTKDKKTKGLLIGRSGKNLRLLSTVVQRFFQKEVKIE